MNNCFKSKIKVKLYSEEEENEIKKIIRENYYLPVHEIKKKVKQRYLEITNEDMERIICDMSKNRKKEGYSKSSKKTKSEKKAERDSDR